MSIVPKKQRLLLQACLAAVIIATPAASTSPPTPQPQPLPPPIGEPVTIPGPEGPLAGSYVDAGKGAPVAIIIPGSGPTDRNGNNPMGVKANSYALLAQALQSNGVSTLRIDKRGMFGSKAALSNANVVTMSDYSHDVRGWMKWAQQKTGASCIWLIGHSEGGLVALWSTGGHMGRPRSGCGLVLLATPGRPLGIILREQLAANPANAPLLEAANGAIGALEAGETVDMATLPPALAPLFNPEVQPFLRELMRFDPAEPLRYRRDPVMVVSGGRDLQVTAKDRDAFAANRSVLAGMPQRCIVTFEAMNHILKDVPADDRAANLASYANPALPLTPGLAPTIAQFIKTNGSRMGDECQR